MTIVLLLYLTNMGPESLRAFMFYPDMFELVNKGYVIQGLNSNKPKIRRVINLTPTTFDPHPWNLCIT